jgi:hypothetical protein
MLAVLATFGGGWKILLRPMMQSWDGESMQTQKEWALAKFEQLSEKTTPALSK